MKLRYLFQCCILIPMKYPPKTLFHHTDYAHHTDWPHQYFPTFRHPCNVCSYCVSRPSFCCRCNFFNSHSAMYTIEQCNRSNIQPAKPVFRTGSVLFCLVAHFVLPAKMSPVTQRLGFIKTKQLPATEVSFTLRIKI